MPRRTGPALSLDQLTAARRAYEQGATFAAIADQHGVPERTLRRLLVAVGVEPRARGSQPRELPVEMILADHDGGASARSIAAKHGIEHHSITALLRRHGREPDHRQAVLLRLPPLVIPMRTAAEREVRTWTVPELRAIAQAVRAGRVTYASRGRSGLPERPGRAAWSAAGYAFVMAMRRLRAA